MERGPPGRFFVKVWPLVVGLVGLVVAGLVYGLTREPKPVVGSRAGRELPRAEVERVAAPVPARFSGPLAGRVEEFHRDPEQSPPLSHVRFRLLEKDRAMGEKYLAALREAARELSTVQELERLHGGPLGIEMKELDLDEFSGIRVMAIPCEWLVERLSDEAGEHALVREMFWRRLVFCPGPAVEDLFVREDAPGFLALMQYRRFNGPWMRPAVERATRFILAENRQELFAKAAGALWGFGTPTARALLQELEQRAEGETVAALQTMAAQWERHGRKVDEGWRPRCAFIPVQPEGIDPMKLDVCLSSWAAQDWAATARLAFALTGSFSDDWSIEDSFGTLMHFPSVVAQDAWARERKLLPNSWPKPGNSSEQIELIPRLRAAGRIFTVDTRAGLFPHRHDELLVTLAWKLHPELAGVAFEEIAPEMDSGWTEPEERAGSYLLRAYAGGQRYSVAARNWPLSRDIDAVVGLLNHLLEARGSPTRFAILFGHHWDVDIVTGSEAALREADALGLWRLAAKGEVLARAEAGFERFFQEVVGE